MYLRLLGIVMKIKALLCALSAFICTYTGAAENKPEQPSDALTFYDKAKNVLFPDIYRAKNCEKFITDEIDKIKENFGQERQDIINRFFADILTIDGAWKEYQDLLEKTKQELLKKIVEKYPDSRTGETEVIEGTKNRLNKLIDKKHEQKFKYKLKEAKRWHCTTTSIIALFCGFFGGALQTIIDQHTVTPPTNLAGTIFSVLSAGFFSSTTYERRRISINKPLLGPIVSTAAGHLFGRFCTKKLIASVNQRFIEDMIFPALCHPST